jgi:hypothetical protein
MTGRAVGRELPELGELGVPRPARALRSIEDLAVGRQLDDLDRGESRGAKLAGDELCRGMKAA